jgi:hypothetical protein
VSSFWGGGWCLSCYSAGPGKVSVLVRFGQSVELLGWRLVFKLLLRRAGQSVGSGEVRAKCRASGVTAGNYYVTLQGPGNVSGSVEVGAKCRTSRVAPLGCRTLSSGNESN